MKTVTDRGRSVQVDDSAELTETNLIAKVSNPTLPDSYLVLVRGVNRDTRIWLPILDYQIDENGSLIPTSRMFLSDTLLILDLSTGQVSWTYSANAKTLPPDPLPPSQGGA